MTSRDGFEPHHPAAQLLTEALERDLLTRYGPILGQEDLRQALGYPSLEAFRQGLARRQLPVPVFTLPNRRGKFALTKEVAAWLARARLTAPMSDFVSSDREDLP